MRRPDPHAVAVMEADGDLVDGNGCLYLIENRDFPTWRIARLSADGWSVHGERDWRDGRAP